MHIVSLSFLFGLLALAKGSSTAYLFNECGYDVYYAVIYYASLMSGNAPPMNLIPSSGISIPFLPDNATSIKLSLTNQLLVQNITQFDYMWAVNQSKVYYDISNQNGYPFIHSGLRLQPSDSSCHTVICPANEACRDAYTIPGENHSWTCGGSTDLSLYLCQPFPI